MKKNRNYIIGLGIIAFLIAGYFIADSILFDGFKPKQIKQKDFQANYYAKNETVNKPAIMLIGGGQWGDYWGAQFADKGFVGFSLPYSRNEGLPKLPEEIPLEYFEHAIKWLGEQTEVNPQKIIVMGASRNAELSLVIASVFPDLISGVIAYAPSSVSWSNTVLPFNSNTIKASWTYKGEDIPYIPMDKFSGNDSNKIETLEYWKSGLEKTDYVAQATIKVENINGPILLFSGKDDMVWPSSFMADMIDERIKNKNFKYAIENIQFENAGHLISRNPDSDNDTSERNGKMTIDGKSYEFSYGGTQAGDNKAKKLARNKVFEFIEKR